MKHARDFAIERRVAALVVANAALVDPNVRTVVGCSDMEKCTRVRPGRRVEIALIPDHPFVVEQLRHLRIPVARNSQRGSSRKIVFLIVFAHDVRVLIQGVGLVIDLPARRVERRGWRLVNEVVPFSVQAGHAPVIDAHQKSLQPLLTKDTTRSEETDGEDTHKDRCPHRQKRTGSAA
jgi:hypothetical protein